MPAAPRRVDADTTLPTVRSYVDGDNVDSTSGETFVAVYPATNRVICAVEQAADAEVEAAVESAQRPSPTTSTRRARSARTAHGSSCSVTCTRSSWHRSPSVSPP